jgi:hypothetical protein
MFAFAFALTMASYAVAQDDRRDVFDPNTKVTWLGLDFTEAKFLGDRERLGSESDMRRLIESWNTILVKEAEKYDAAAAIDRKKVDTNVDVAIEHNQQLEVLEKYSDDQKDYLHIKPSDVQKIVSDYDFKGLHGLGMIFIVESFSKLNVEGSFWVTFVNLDSKEVLFTEHIVADPKGFGMRNYWAGAVYGVLEKMKKKEFENWRKKYYRP